MQYRIYLFVLIVIFALAFFLRFYKLGEVPYGFYQDESAIGYNAYSIIETGKDEYGRSFPLYFKSFGDYKLPVYIYATVVSIKLLGLNEFAVRFPSTLFGLLTIVVFFFFVKEISKDERLALVATGLLSVNPWHLHYSRATFEVSISLFLFVLGGYLLHKALTTGRQGVFLLGTLCFVLDIYTYNLTRLLSPLLFGLILILYRDKVKALSKKEIMLTIFASSVLLIPFVLTIFQQGGIGSARGTLIFSSAQVQAPLLEFRSYLIELPSAFTKLFFNQWTLTKWQYVQNVASYFSVPFFFISGSPHGNHGIGNVGQFYLFELPLIILGITLAFRQKLPFRNLLVFWGILAILVASLTREAPHATRSFFLLVPLIIFSSLGFVGVWDWLRKRDAKQKTILTFIFGGFIFYSLLFYLSSYYVRFPILYAKAWRSEDKALSLYVAENKNKYSKVIFDKETGFVYTSFLFYTAYDPFEFQKSVIREQDDLEGFSRVLSFGKYESKDIDWSQDLKEGTLIITTPDGKPETILASKTFFYPKRPVVIAKGQEILQYPVEDVAYVLVEEK